MRSYPRNSPQAAARIVALMLIADGHVCRSEIEALERLDASSALGLDREAFGGIVHALCEDLLMGAYSGGSMLSQVDESTLASLMAEVQDPGLRAQVLRLALGAADADKHLAEGEQWVLGAARLHWGLPSEDDDEPNAHLGRASLCLPAQPPARVQALAAAMS